MPRIKSKYYFDPDKSGQVMLSLKTINRKAFFKNIFACPERAKNTNAGCNPAKKISYGIKALKGRNNKNHVSITC